MITERGCAGYDSRGRLTHAWGIFRVNGLRPSLSLSSWVGRQGRTVVYINRASPPRCTLRIETLTHSPLHCAHAKPFVRCSLRQTTYVRNSRTPPASANSNTSVLKNSHLVALRWIPASLSFSRTFRTCSSCSSRVFE